MQTMKNAGRQLNPKISPAMRMGAQSVLLALANTAAKPRAAARATGIPNMLAMKIPKVAPMAKSGVTTPPINPAESVRIVSANFRIQSYPAIPAAFPKSAAVPTAFAASPAAFAEAKHISNKFVPSPA